MHAHAHTHTHMHTAMHTRTHAHTHAQTQIHAPTCAHITTTHQYLEAVGATWDLEGLHPLSLLVGTEHFIDFGINA